MKVGPLLPAQLEELRQFSTCIVASAIETFKVRLPNTGFTDLSVRCVFDDLPPIAGYAVTARIRTSEPPMEGGNYYYDRNDWWDRVLAIPAPRVIVIEDMDQPPGLGAFVGEVHANILMALGCVGIVTNGAVRDLPNVRAAGFQMFARNVSVSHAYAHIFESGSPVRVGGLEIRPGDLLHGDRHGVQTVPEEVAARVPAVAREIMAKRKRVIQLCHSTDFSIKKLRELIKAIESKG